MELGKNVFRALPGCFMILEAEKDLRILSVSNAYCTMTGITRSIVGQSFSHIFSMNAEDEVSSTLSKLTESFHQVLQNGEGNKIKVGHIEMRNGQNGKTYPQWWEAHNIPIFDAKGEMEYIIHSLENITEKERLLQRLNKREASTQQQINDAISTTQEMERMEISRELHDNINQILITAKWYLDRAIQKEAIDRSLVISGLELVEKSMEEIRKLSTALRETTSEEEGLNESLEQLLEHAMNGASLNVHKDISLPDETFIESKVKTTIFRIVQEQLSNVVKHADAKNLFLSIMFSDNQLHLTITDDGKGFHPENLQHGLGLLNMKSRVALLNGTIEINSAPGDGCTIEVKVPVKGNMA